jgi:glycosyltransferase involved in cell wall biosynthesis
MDMKALVISPRVSGLGGVAQHVRKLVELLKRDGHEVDVVSVENTSYLPVKGLMNPSFALAALAKAAAGRLMGCRYDVVHAHNVPSAPAMRVARGGRVLTLHGVFSEQVGYLHGGLAGRLGAWAERKALEWADAITAVSRSATEHYRSLGFNVLYVPNAIDPADLPVEGTRFFERQVVYCGRLSREKGVDLLIEAIKRIDANLVVVGGGPLERELRELARGNPRVSFTGPLPRGEALKLVKGSDVFVLPSRHEGLSTALLEAMAMGVPVVATRVGGNLELVEHGETGLLVEPEPGQLAGAISLLLEDRDLAKRLAENAAKIAREKYSWPVVYRQYLDVYRMVAE